MLPFDPIFIAYGAVFVGMLLLIEGLYYIFSDYVGSGRGIRNRRLRMLASGASGQQVMHRLRRRPAEAQGFSLRGMLLSLPAVGWVDRVLTLSGVQISTPKVVLAMAAVAVGLFTFGYGAWGQPWGRALAVALAVGFALPALSLHFMAGRRRRRFESQLPEAVDMIVRSLRAGHPVSTAIGMVAREMPDPIGSEFGLVFDEMTYGLDLREALDSLGRRIPIADLHYLVVAVRIQYGTGGNLAEVLSGLSRVVRERERMHRRIHALSAEGRLSAIVLSLLPFVLLAIVGWLSPEYYRAVMGDPMFMPFMMSGVMSMLFGIFIMYRMVNFRV